MESGILSDAEYRPGVPPRFRTGSGLFDAFLVIRSEPDDVARRLPTVDSGGWQREIAENARRYQELRDRLARVSITETSPDGMVRATVSTTGALTDLVLTERWQDVPLPRVGEQIMACVRRAQARIPDLLRQAVRDTVGTEDPAAQQLLADARQPSAEPVVPRPAPGPVRQPGRTRVPATADDEDWTDSPVLESVEGDLR